MEKTAKDSPTSLQSHFVDIHEVLEEEEGEGEEGEDHGNTTTNVLNTHDHDHGHHGKVQLEIKPKNKLPNLNNNRDVKRPTNSMNPRRSILSRQVSLETGFSREKERRSLPRSGRSFGGFEYSVANRLGMEGKNKGDFSIFRTKSSLNKQNSLLPSRNKDHHNYNHHQAVDHHQTAQNVGGCEEADESVVPAGRYFAALTGPELDQVKEYEDILLPKDETWPFLLRFPINSFGICLGLSSQAVLWRALSTSPATKFLNITPLINLVLWLLSLALLISVSLTYILKCIFYFEAVRREYFHPVRVNFFFAPWVVCMFLSISIPPILAPSKGALHPALWCAFMGPYFFLELKIYGQWLSGGKRRLCKVVNPSTHLSVVGNFVGAILASKVGWEEAAKFLWAVGFAHYLVVFVTLYQRLPTSEALPKELHPVYSMFIAAPSAASIAWYTIYGEFDGLSRTCFFIALFLYVLFVVRLNFFIGFRFSLSWWSYTFPTTTASVATIKYAEQVPSFLSKGLAVTLSFMSSTMVCVLLVSTLLHAFFWRTLFPNDLAIAITKRRLVKEKKPGKQPYNIKRWTRQALKRNLENKDCDAEKDERY